MKIAQLGGVMLVRLYSGPNGVSRPEFPGLSNWTCQNSFLHPHRTHRGVVLGGRKKSTVRTPAWPISSFGVEGFGHPFRVDLDRECLRMFEIYVLPSRILPVGSALSAHWSFMPGQEFCPPALETSDRDTKTQAQSVRGKRSRRLSMIWKAHEYDGTSGRRNGRSDGRPWMRAPIKMNFCGREAIKCSQRVFVGVQRTSVDMQRIVARRCRARAKRLRGTRVSLRNIKIEGPPAHSWTFQSAILPSAGAGASSL